MLCSGRAYNIPTIVVPPGITLYDGVGDIAVCDVRIQIAPFEPPGGLILMIKPDDSRPLLGGPIRLEFDGGDDSTIFVSASPILIIPERKCVAVWHAELFGFAAWLAIDVEYVANAAVNRLCGDKS
jgi:hypothetical protein